MTRRGSAGTAAAVALLLATAFLPGAASGQELLLLSEAPRIRKITIEGNERFDDAEIRDQMVSRMPPWYLKLFRTPKLYRGQLDQDVQSIQAFYRSHGYLRARITAESVPAEDGVEVKVSIEEDVPVQIVGTDVRGLADNARGEVLRTMQDQPGQALSPYTLDEDRLRIEGWLADRGRPYGRVEDNVQFHGNDAFVAMLVEQGPMVRIGEVSLEGAGGVDSSGLARELTVEPGDQFSRAELTRTRQRLYDLGLFTDVTPRFPDQPDTVVDVTFELRKRRQSWVGFGVGYSNSNESFLRFSEEWGTRNIFGTGRRFSLAARSTHAFLQDRPFLEVGDAAAEGSWYEPWVLATRIRGRLAGYYRYDNVSVREIQQHFYGSTGELSKELKERVTNVALQLEARWVRNVLLPGFSDEVCLEDPILCRERYRTRLMSLRFAYDDRESFLNPNHGSRHDVLSQLAGGFLGGDNNFQKNVISSSFYTGGPRGPVVSTRIRVGSINPSGDLEGLDTPESAVEVPSEDRFQVGGATSVRGYQEGSLNGLENGRDPSGGGLVEFLVNAEFRFAIRGSFGGVLFLDAGNVWRDFDKVRIRHLVPTFDSSETEVEHVRYAVGGGLRLNTPVGPIRLESAVRLSPRKDTWPDGDRVRDVHFVVGQTF